MKINKDVLDAMQWAADYITEYQKSGNFDPFRALQGTEDREQRLFTESVNFLHEMQELTDAYRATRNKITFTV